MSGHIIESIGKWGVVHAPTQYRLNKVRPGDIIQVPENLRFYPHTHEFSRIATVSQDGIAHVCENMGSAYLLQDGSCDISGGPFWSVPISLLEPTGTLKQADYWNWGNNSPGSGHGVHYTIARPVHKLTVNINELAFRYGINETQARKVRFNHEMNLKPDEWSILHVDTQPQYNGEFLYIFRKIQQPTT